MIMYSVLGLVGTLAAVSYIHDVRVKAKQKREQERLDAHFDKYFTQGRW